MFMMVYMSLLSFSRYIDCRADSRVHEQPLYSLGSHGEGKLSPDECHRRHGKEDAHRRTVQRRPLELLLGPFPHRVAPVVTTVCQARSRTGDIFTVVV